MSNLENTFSIFLCGDIMIGRGIDQILRHHNHPQLYERYVTDAREYVFLAEKLNGKINYPVAADYIWGDALEIWQKLQPTIKIVNLETAITQNDYPWPDKGINYRMHPLNIDVLKAVNIDVCTLANNHILDWNDEGLTETLSTLKNSNIQFSGVGENLAQAMQPAIFELNLHKRILIFSAGMPSSGVPSEWKATSKRPGLYYIPDTSQDSLDAIVHLIKQYRKPNDLIIFSLHWGSNWGYEVSEASRFFAHGLIEEATVDVIFGHSSHHPRPIEIYQNKLILYGCGDFINDYEGISGYENYRGDLTLMYFLDFDMASLQLKKITLIPLQIKNFSLHHASEEDARWLLKIINQISFRMKFSFQDDSFIYHL